MTVKQLQNVIAVADTGSMHEAAKVLGVSQPSVSMSANSLEKEIGFSVFVRTRHGISLTEEGRRFIELIKPVVNEFEKIEKAYAAVQD